MKNKYIHYFLVLLVVVLLTSCTAPKSVKQINFIDKNITTIQQEVKEVKKNIVKTKQAIIKIKQEQPICNLIEIDDRIEMLDIQINSIDNNLSNAKEQIEISKDIIKIEVKEYRNKFYKSIVYIIILTFLLVLIIFNKIKVNIIEIIGYIKNILNWFKKK